jgi:hypothetical protein
LDLQLTGDDRLKWLVALRLMILHRTPETGGLSTCPAGAKLAARRDVLSFFIDCHLRARPIQKYGSHAIAVTRRVQAPRHKVKCGYFELRVRQWILEQKVKRLEFVDCSSGG